VKPLRHPGLPQNLEKAFSLHFQKIITQGKLEFFKTFSKARNVNHLYSVIQHNEFFKFFI
jgi:hypothetical protein